MARNPRGPGSTFCDPVGRRVHTSLLRPSAVRRDRSFPMPAKIVINGYGTNGKRVADAVALQGDMNVVGVVKTRPDFEAKLAVRKAYALYAATDDALRMYEKAGVKAIWQGGEDHALTNLSFNAAANYDECLGASFVRVPSCNTTGLIRTLHPLDAGLGVDRALAVLVRRATDPGDSKKGPINAIEPELEMPSHHGPDVQSVLPKLNIHTIALKVPTTLMHVHVVSLDLKKAADEDRIVEVWKRQPRITFVEGGEGVKSTAQIMEMARDLSRNRSDLYEVAVWRDGVHVVDGKFFFYCHAVHQESDVVPENVDAIRALLELEKDGRRSMEKTDRSLGIGLAR